MRRTLLAGAFCAASLGAAQTFSEQYASCGDLILTSLPSAPFPHPKRAEGHRYKEQFFSADEHYRDSTVAIFVPKGYRRNATVHFVVHFHGWRNNVTNALPTFELIEQFAESGRNAILVVPQGPRDAPDSFGGKLEDEGGFKRFMTDVARTLQTHPTFGHKNIAIGRIVLSGHSGGYQVISSILAQGGLTERIEEVWLFDALYAQADRFLKWFDQQHGRLVNIYTERGGTKRETERLMARLTERGTSFLSSTETEVAVSALRTNKLVFLFTGLSHDDVLARHRTFREYLSTSSLAETGNNKLIVAPPRRSVPGRRVKLELGDLYVPDFFRASESGTNNLVIFFHGAAWCAEQSFYDARKNAVLVTINHTNLATLFRAPKQFDDLLATVTAALAGQGFNSTGIGRVCLASFSGGYTAVQGILKHPELEERVSDTVLADSLYAPRRAENTNALDTESLAPLVGFARRAAEGKATFVLSHLFPPEEHHQNNTTTLAATYLIEQIRAERRPAAGVNSRGARLLYRADRGNFHALGYAGMNNQDHFDHFYALADLLRQTSLEDVR